MTFYFIYSCLVVDTFLEPDTYAEQAAMDQGCEVLYVGGLLEAT